MGLYLSWEVAQGKTWTVFQRKSRLKGGGNKDWISPGKWIREQPRPDFTLNPDWGENPDWILAYN